MKYVYPAIFYKNKRLPETYSVIFPDVEGAATCGYSLYEAIFMAEDALAGMLAAWEDGKISNKITAPTAISKINAVPDEYSTEAFVTLIKADTDAYRKANAEEEVEGKTLLLPHYDDVELPETLTREICRVAGIDYAVEE